MDGWMVDGCTIALNQQCSGRIVDALNWSPALVLERRME